MPLYRRSDSPVWYYDFTLGGRRFRGSTHKEGKREAAGVEHEAKQTARTTLPRASGWRLRDTLGHYWTERAERSRSSDTTFARLEHLSRILGKDARSTSVTNAILLDYRAKRRGEGVSDSTVNREIAVLKSAYRHATEVHAQPAPILAWAALARKEPPPRTRYLTHDEYKALIEAAHLSIRPIIACAVMTGLRKETILSLQWNQVDLAGARFSVVGKGDKRHVVRIAPPLMAVMSTLPRKRDRAGKLVDGAVFQTLNFRKRWDAAIANTKLVDFHFHDLRHTFATWARMAGADIADICEALNHSEISTTMRYAHVMPDVHVSAFDRVAATFSSQSTSQEKLSA